MTHLMSSRLSLHQSTAQTSLLSLKTSRCRHSKPFTSCIAGTLSHHSAPLQQHSMPHRPAARMVSCTCHSFSSWCNHNGVSTSISRPHGSTGLFNTRVKRQRAQQRHAWRLQSTASGNSHSNNRDNTKGPGGLVGLLQQWNNDSQKLREQLQSLGLAGVVAYGLFNTLYYTVAFLFVWFTVANVPAGLGIQAAGRKALEVFALVWAGSQVTKLLRAGAALAFAPIVDQCLSLAVDKLKLKNKQQAFALVVTACLALAAMVFGAVVAVHA